VFRVKQPATVHSCEVSAPHHPAGRLLELAQTLETHRGFADVVASLRAGHGGTIGGTWGSGSALTAAALATALEPQTDAVLVVVLPHAADADSFADDLALFTAAATAILPAPTLPTPRRPDSRSSSG
jgi:transcription-repair coupling factor (superfamily II helicase)